MYDARYENNATLADMIENNQWVWQNEWRTSFPDLITMSVPLLNDQHDKAIWRCNDDRVFQWNKDTTMRCSLCNTCMDSHDHLFFQCQYANDVWDDVKDKGYLINFKREWVDTVSHMDVGHGRTIKSVVSRIVFGAVIYYIWQERNKRCFTQKKRSAQALCGIILDIPKMRLISLHVKNSANVREVARDWDVKFKNIQSVS
ncbi:hypothetical protein Tco_0456057 [Tanacetum coccineum]